MNVEHSTSNVRRRRTRMPAAATAARVLDYARRPPDRRRVAMEGGQLAVALGVICVLLVACIVAATVATAAISGVWKPRIDVASGLSFLALPLFAAATLASASRGLMPESRFRGRAVLGVKLAAAAVAAAFAVIGCMAVAGRG